MNARAAVSLALAALSAGGCAVTGTRQFESWETPARSIVVDSVAALPVEHGLVVGRTVVVELGASGATLSVNGRSEFALLFTLPPWDEPRTLTVISRYMGRPEIVYPQVRLLDAGRAVTREIPLDRYSFRVGFQTTIFFNPANRHERYVLITAHPSPDGAIASVLPREHPTVIVKLKPASTGVLMLELRPYRPERLGSR